MEDEISWADYQASKSNNEDMSLNPFARRRYQSSLVRVPSVKNASKKKIFFLEGTDRSNQKASNTASAATRECRPAAAKIANQVASGCCQARERVRVGR